MNQPDRMDRWGAHLKAPDSPASSTLLAGAFGEDWVVPKQPVAYLILTPTANAGVLSAYDALGRLVGERFDPSTDHLLDLLHGLAARGIADGPIPIPEPEKSALRYLRGRFGAGPTW